MHRYDTHCIQTVKTVQELRRPVYHGIASRAVPFDQVLIYKSLDPT